VFRGQSHYALITNIEVGSTVAREIDTSQLYRVVYITVDFKAVLVSKNSSDTSAIIDFSGGRYLLKGHTPIEEFNEFFNVKLQTEDVDTVAGLVVVTSNERNLRESAFKTLK
jgi:hypothetical protein